MKTNRSRYLNINSFTSTALISAVAAYMRSATAAPRALGTALNRPNMIDCLNIIKAIGPNEIDSTIENSRDR
ncbi:hypothetical protein D3C87_1628660 [compost metagenome]